MHTELQSAILAALRVRHPEAMTDDDIRTATGDYASINHALACTIACLQLLQNDEIELVEGGKKWKLTGTEDAQSSQGNVGQMVGADYGEAAPCTETAGADEILSAQDGPSVALPTYIGRNAGRQGGADCQAPSQIQDAPLREVAESSQSGHGFAPQPAHSGETGSCGDNLHAFPGNGDAVSLPAGLSEIESGLSTFPAKGTQCEKSCSSTEGRAGMVVSEDQGYLRTTTKAEGGNAALGKTLSEYQASPTGLTTSDQIGAERATGGDTFLTENNSSPSMEVPHVDHHLMPSPLRAMTSASNDVPQSFGEFAAESDAGPRLLASQPEDGPASNLLSPEFHAIHVADEGANSTRAWWGELEREAQEAIAGELVSNERWR